MKWTALEVIVKLKMLYLRAYCYGSIFYPLLSLQSALLMNENIHDSITRLGTLLNVLS
jgi:hypothetical protein